MQFIPMNILEYRLNEDGITETIVVAFQTYQGNEQFNARVSITNEYVKSLNENNDLDKLPKNQIEQFARWKMRDWILTNRPEPIPEPEEPEEEQVGEETAE